MGLRYKCPLCGWLCFNEETADYHREWNCRDMKQLASVLVARLRSGLTDHVGVRVGNLEITMNPN